MHMFPPMVNTLFLERQVENEVRAATGQASSLAVEFGIKEKITQVFNNAAPMFWFPPSDLLAPSYVKGRAEKL